MIELENDRTDLMNQCSIKERLFSEVNTGLVQLRNLYSVTLTTWSTISHEWWMMCKEYYRKSSQHTFQVYDREISCNAVEPTVE